MKSTVFIGTVMVLAALFGCKKSKQASKPRVNYTKNLAGLRHWTGFNRWYTPKDSGMRTIVDDTIAIASVDDTSILFGSAKLIFSGVDSTNGRLSFSASTSGSFHGSTELTYHYINDSVTYGTSTYHLDFYDITYLHTF